MFNDALQPSGPRAKQPSVISLAYRGSDPRLTRLVTKQLEQEGDIGHIAATLFRAQKASSRAKTYRGEYIDYAYGRKNRELGKLCTLLGQSAFNWGWREDSSAGRRGFGPRWVLYIDLPDGQVSFHAFERLCDKGYDASWDGKHESESRILSFCHRLLIEGNDAELQKLLLLPKCPRWARHYITRGYSISEATALAAEEIFEREWLAELTVADIDWAHVWEDELRIRAHRIQERRAELRIKLRQLSEELADVARHCKLGRPELDYRTESIRYRVWTMTAVTSSMLFRNGGVVKKEHQGWSVSFTHRKKEELPKELRDNTCP